MSRPRAEMMPAVDRAAEAERIAHGQRPIRRRASCPKSPKLTAGSALVSIDLEQGEIGGRVAALSPSPQYSVPSVSVTLISSASSDDVVVGDDVAGRIDQEARAQRLRLLRHATLRHPGSSRRNAAHQLVEGRALEGARIGSE